MNRAFQERFREFLEKRNLTPRSAAYAADLVVSSSALGNWRDGQEPTPKSIRMFFSRFEGEDVSEWLRLVTEAPGQAAAIGGN